MREVWWALGLVASVVVTAVGFMFAAWGGYQSDYTGVISGVIAASTGGLGIGFFAPGRLW
jgi:hypothetical protein